jgi:SAM-dependent methyltransferase
MTGTTLPVRSLVTRLRHRWNYARYRWAQVRQTRAKRHKDAGFRLRPFAALVRAHCPELGPASEVLSLGPRNEIELDILEQARLGRVTGLDLWPSCGRILRGDMHRMPFADRRFDLVFASHVFEHAFDFSRVAAECLRVLRPGGTLFCAVPTGFEPNEHDRTVFRTPEGIVAHFAAGRPSVLHRAARANELVLLLRLAGEGRA